tara:strand:- start:519 stop:836 length:318 start_codon:yes stop_codon:yes gene_type:complete
MSYNTGNIVKMSVISVTLSPAAVAANTSAEQTFTVNGLLPGDHVSCNKPTAQAGLGIVGCRVSAANTLAITFGNFTGSSITPTALQVYSFLVARPDSTLTDANLP